MVLIWCLHSQQLLLMTFALRLYLYLYSKNEWKSLQIPTWFWLLLLNLHFQLYYQVTASSWLNDLRDQVERTRVLNVVYRSATALGSRLPSMASAKARVAGAGALLRPVSSSTQVNIYILVSSPFFRVSLFSMPLYLVVFPNVNHRT